LPRYDCVLFDLLTALLDSWSLFNQAAGGDDAGRAWRAAYLKRTYACGAYRPYETLVREAASDVGLPIAAPDALEAHWSELAPWEGVESLLANLRGTHKLGIVTNCSERLGREAAARLGVPFDCVVTAERTGFYKPHPRPYLLALEELQTTPQRTLFVAGSGYDLFGTAAVGLDTFWHNRIGLARPQGAPAAMVEAGRIEGVAEIARGE
jgi:2-haloacid dehalogenase